MVIYKLQYNHDYKFFNEFVTAFAEFSLISGRLSLIQNV